MEKKDTVVAVSGAFDPIHEGHIVLLKEAAKLGRVIVILKGNQRLKRKKGTFLMDEKARMDILRSIRYVHEVIIYDTPEPYHHNDFSQALRDIRPDVYAAGADKKTTDDLKEVVDTCRQLGITILYEVGGHKISSSSVILKNYVENTSK